MNNYIVDIFRDIVKQVSLTQEISDKILELYPLNNGAITYLHGHPTELVKVLNEILGEQNCGANKYPAILLFQDFEEREIDSKYSTADLHLIIVNSTTPHLLAHERYEKIFKPLLMPIYDRFIQLVRRRNADYKLNTRKIDRLYWGQKGLAYYDEGGTKNVFNDYLDAIEVFITFKYLTKNCKQNEALEPDCASQI